MDHEKKDWRDEKVLHSLLCGRIPAFQKPEISKPQLGLRFLPHTAREPEQLAKPRPPSGWQRGPVGTARGRLSETSFPYYLRPRDLDCVSIPLPSCWRASLASWSDLSF